VRGIQGDRGDIPVRAVPDEFGHLSSLGLLATLVTH
jgi:hypothetical protein